MDKRIWKENGGLERSGPDPVPVAVPRLPSPARHLSRPDNGTSGAEHAPCFDPAAERELGDSGPRARGGERRPSWRGPGGGDLGSCSAGLSGPGCPLPTPGSTEGGPRPEAAPTVGSVLPLVLHGRSGRGGESQPPRPQPERAGGYGLRRPAWPRPRPRPRPRPPRQPPQSPSNGSLAGSGGGERGGASPGWVEPLPLFPGCAQANLSGGVMGLILRPFIHPFIHSCIHQT